MNVYGFEKKIKKAKLELRNNQMRNRRRRILEKRIRCWRRCIEKIKKEK